MMAGDHDTTKRNLRLALLGAACGALVGAAAGCQNDPNHPIHGELFPPDEAVRPVDRAVEVQSAAAARSDATLNNYHFDRGGVLNSLGRAKLDLMLKDDDASLPMLVYVDIREHGDRSMSDVSRYEDSARRYLADRGLRDDRVEFHSGPNLSSTRPARDGLRGLKRLEGTEQSGAGEGDTPPSMTDLSSPKPPGK
jgi:hypothetical protein